MSILSKLMRWIWVVIAIHKGVVKIGKREEKKKATLCRLCQVWGFTSIIFPFTLSSQRVLVSFLSILSKLMRRIWVVITIHKGLLRSAREKRRKTVLSIDFVKYEVLHASFPPFTLRSRRASFCFLSILSREKRKNLSLSSNKEGVVNSTRERRRKRLLSVKSAKKHTSFP